MKFRIFYSSNESLYHIQTKSFLAGWKKRSNYFFTDANGNVKRITGFDTYSQAEDWLQDRYPGFNPQLSDSNVKRNSNIGFEF